MLEQDYVYNAVINRWIDADTVEVAIDLGFHTHRVETIRIYNYDAPETRLYEGVSAEEKSLGIEAKEYANNILPVGTTVILKTHYDKTGKYGRFLGELFFTFELEQGHTVFGKYSEIMKAKGYVKEN